MRTWIHLLLVLLQVALALAADPSHLVQGLPGQPEVGFKQYAGQAEINATAGRALFYWFFEADHPNASSLPLVLWLTGGPGCSSIGAGALGETGPFSTNNSGTGLVRNPYSWNKAVNLICLEIPYNTGFSYTNLLSDGGNYTDNQTASDTLLFLLEFLTKFPEYKQNDFFVAGESFAGHYIPTLASQIISHNEQNGNRINLKGFAIGNPSTDVDYDGPGNIENLYSHSIISEELCQEEKTYCRRNDDESIARCRNATSQIRNLIAYITPYNIYAPACNLLSGPDDEACLDSVTPYLNRQDVQAALHVETRPVRWQFCNPDIDRNYSTLDRERSMLPVYQHLFKSGLRIWIYSGDLDAVVSTLSTRSWIKALNLTVVTPWYGWNYRNQVGGWTEVYSEMTFATVRGAGHQPPFDKPGESLALFQHFIEGKALPSF
ncbi:serine carboxypeptidase 24 isoform X2 [Selaginella moellendorffii]|uniref:serine carboxypeptidase 24 isoform X2 n=1 Tax=Selaginella moellendorffii TaxID=88036 RepID=UPI000D1C698B|nr:serine carboxypeptidase 24 isoform X2 [Selaginella moellendorffii]|eukprot:XP_024524634.1 serine carboxypeptidase 24 isoform X2 [Selaginella moellendorffii]